MGPCQQLLLTHTPHLLCLVECQHPRRCRSGPTISSVGRHGGWFSSWASPPSPSLCSSLRLWPISMGRPQGVGLGGGGSISPPLARAPLVHGHVHHAPRVVPAPGNAAELHGEMVSAARA